MDNRLSPEKKEIVSMRLVESAKKKLDLSERENVMNFGNQLNTPDKSKQQL